MLTLDLSFGVAVACALSLIVVCVIFYGNRGIELRK